MNNGNGIFSRKELFWKSIYGIMLFFMTIALYFMAIPMRQDIANINKEISYIRVKVDILERNNELLYEVLVKNLDGDVRDAVQVFIKE